MSEEITISLPDDLGFRGRHVPPFIVGDKHTVFEWCMIYTQRHPSMMHHAHNGASHEDMDLRLTLLGVTDSGIRNVDPPEVDGENRLLGTSSVVRPSRQTMREVYHELVRRTDELIKGGKVALPYCDDANVPDPTRCVIGLDPVLAVARLFGDYGQAMALLLAAHDGEEAGAKPKPRGPKPELREGVTGRMLADLRSGKRTTDELRGDTGEALAATYGSSRNTAVEARKEALAQFSNCQR